jgi:phosphatidylserine/phosphatidylglycerophosphate/cardiolipin synthase-like enzyme
VHCKIVVVDGAMAYLGSANWTGAGLGAKGEGRRNFELGLLSRDDLLLDDVQAFFDAIWHGRPCAHCKRRDLCPQPLG